MEEGPFVAPIRATTTSTTATSIGQPQHHHYHQHQHPGHDSDDSSYPHYTPDCSPEDDTTDVLGDLKRPRACDQCRHLKVRCELDSAHPTTPCRRCAKAGRRCLISAPSRKRQKKTDSRVAELEKKIDALTSTLQASRQTGRGAVFPHRMSPSMTLREGLGDEEAVEVDGDSAYRQPTREASGEGDHSEPREGAVEPNRTTLDPVLHGPEVADVIDRHIIDHDSATKAFDRYIRDYTPIMPVVIFPSGTTMATVRRTQPVLWLAMITVAIGPFQPPAIQVRLSEEAYRTIADRFVVKGDKSLELVQAVFTLSMWYVLDDNLEELKFFQLVHTAVVIAMEIGLGRRTKKQSKPSWNRRDSMYRRAPAVDLDAPESRRAWLGCYFLAVNVSMALRRTLMVRWQPYMEESLEILRTSPGALPSDQLLIHWAKLSRIAEDVAFQFSMDDPGINISLSEPKVQYSLKGFEKQLEQWRSEVAPEYYSPILKHAENIVNIYMHEIALHVDHNIDDFQPTFWGGLSDDRQASHATPAHVDALTSLVTSINSVMEFITHVDLDTLICLPTLYFARTSYSMVAMTKLDLAVSAPESRLGKVFDPAQLKLETHLLNVIERLRLAGSRPGGRLAAKFSVIFDLVRTWHWQHKDHGAGLKGVPDSTPTPLSAKPSSETTNLQQQTPLHLLSEVAMGEPSQMDSCQHRPASNSPDTGKWPRPRYPTPPVVSTVSSSQASYPPQILPHLPRHPGLGGPGGTVMSPNMIQSPPPAYPGFVPEFGPHVGFDPDGLFAHGSIMEDGFFALSADLNPNFYMAQ